MDLLGGDSDSDGGDLKINEDYAKRYDNWRRLEETQKLKDKYGKDFDKLDLDSSASSSEEEEDEDAKELTKDVEKEFFKTLSCLKEKNPKIYDTNIQFFSRKPESNESNESKSNKHEKDDKKKEKPLTISAYRRNLILEKGGKVSDEEAEENPPPKMTYVEQEKAIKESFKDFLKDSDDDEEGENWGKMFKKREKTEEEIKQEEEDYKNWLAGEKERLQNEEEEKELKGLHDFWTNPNLDEDEAFLKDYILNRRFLEKDENESALPTYEEIIEEEETIREQEEFEHKYNFRFEEPDQEFIKRYPRTIENSLRKKDDKRKRQREETKTRKEAERARKDEEIKRLKAIKREEILEKIKKLQEVTGNEEMPFDTNDFDGEFDPNEHDKRMSELFNEEYYGENCDEEKPEFPELDEELEIENWDEWNGSNENTNRTDEELHCEDPGFNMDCDYDPRSRKKFQQEVLQSTKKSRKKRRSKFASAVANPKPLFDPKDKNFEKYLDEYYALDYEDLIGDMPCRFKYRSVVPNDYGLSVEEILAAPDKELNSWVSLKKILQRRPDHVEWNEVENFKARSRNIKKKMKFLPSLFAPSEETETVQTEEGSSGKNKKRKHSEITTNEEEANQNKESPKKKKKKKKNKFKAEDSAEISATAVESLANNKLISQNKPIRNPNTSRKINKKNKANVNFHDRNNRNRNHSKKNRPDGFQNKKNSDSVSNLSNERLKSYGLNPKKFKNKLKYRKR